MSFPNLLRFMSGQQQQLVTNGDENTSDASHAPPSSEPSLLEQKQRKVREALQKLKSPPAHTGPQWTAEHHTILSENVRILIDSTSDPKVTQNTDLDDEHDEAEEDDKDVQSEGKERVDSNRNDNENERPRNKEPMSNPASSPQAQKRQQEENQDQSSKPNANYETAQNQRPAKKSKLKSFIAQHALEEFEKVQPQPIRFNFRPHPLKDRSDEWYIEQFRRLFRRIHNFASDYFGLHDLDQGDLHQPWAAGMSPEFLRWVEDVATADPMVGSWDPLLQNTAQRTWLIVGIITRILEIQVFGADLWGAEPQEKELLLGMERGLLNREGDGH
jgi:hypothetical protein